MSCMVKNCRYKNSHVTISHICGKCHDTGHGMIECNSNSMKDDLKQYYYMVVLNPCSICGDNTHTSEGHRCLFCNKHNNHMKNCPENGVPIIDDDNNDLTEFKKLKKGEYCEKYAGMGCMLYIRRNKYKDNLESLFMHSDNWGQYGEDLSDEPRYKAFIYEYKKIEIY